MAGKPVKIEPLCDLHRRVGQHGTVDHQSSADTSLLQPRKNAVQRPRRKVPLDRPAVQEHRDGGQRTCAPLPLQPINQRGLEESRFWPEHAQGVRQLESRVKLSGQIKPAAPVELVPGKAEIRAKHAGRTPILTVLDTLEPLRCAGQTTGKPVWFGKPCDKTSALRRAIVQKNRPARFPRSSFGGADGNPDLAYVGSKTLGKGFAQRSRERQPSRP